MHGNLYPITMSKNDVPQLRNILSERIKTLRKAENLTQEQLAESAELSWNFIANIETKAKTPGLETLVKIANALGVEASELLVGERNEFLMRRLTDILDGIGEFDREFLLSEMLRWAQHLKHGESG